MLRVIASLSDKGLKHCDWSVGGHILNPFMPRFTVKESGYMITLDIKWKSNLDHRYLDVCHWYTCARRLLIE